MTEKFGIQNQLDENGYFERRRAQNGREIGIMPFIYTWAIIADITELGYGDRWCYKDLCSARHAFNEWDGEGEPKGWHRHPVTGRRVDEDGNMYIAK